MEFLHSKANCAIIQKCLKLNKTAHKTIRKDMHPVVYIFCTWNKSGSDNGTKCTKTAATPQSSPLLTTRWWLRTAYSNYCSITYEHPEGSVNKWRSSNNSRKLPLTSKTYLSKHLETCHLELNIICKIFFFPLQYLSNKHTSLQEKRNLKPAKTSCVTESSG